MAIFCSTASAVTSPGRGFPYSVECSKKAAIPGQTETVAETDGPPSCPVLSSGCAEAPLTGKFLRNRGTNSYGSTAETVGGSNVARVPYAFITVTALFFIFGFITNLNMALVPHLRSIFDLPYAWAMLAESAFFLAYFVFASPTSKLIETIGYKRTMVVSLFIQVLGCLMFVPAAKLVSFPLFLTAVFVVGAGVTALQTSANPYVSILGPSIARLSA